jgi:hypothetical protein
MSSVKMGIKDKIKTALVCMDFTPTVYQFTYIDFGLGGYYVDR